MYRLEWKSVPCYKMFKFLYLNKSFKKIKNIFVFINFPIFSVFMGLNFNVYDGHKHSNIKITENMLGGCVKNFIKIEKKSKGTSYVKNKKRY